MIHGLVIKANIQVGIAVNVRDGIETAHKKGNSSNQWQQHDKARVGERVTIDILKVAQNYTMWDG